MMAAAATTENDVENPTPSSPEEDGNDKLQQQQENEGDGTPPAPQKLTTTERKYDNNALLHNTVTTEEKRNINSYYGHKIGFLQTLSLTLNAGLMIYAHLGLSAVILSSRDPSMTENLNTSPPPPIDTTTNNNNDTQIIDENNTANNNQGITDNTNAGQCNTQDIQTWISTGGSTTRPTNSNYCSREYNNLGCLLDATCIERCFQDVYGYSDDCSVCFGKIPGCSIEAGCLLVCANDSLGEECSQCNKPCIEKLNICTGLPAKILEEDNDNAIATQVTISSGGKCNNDQDINIWVTNNGEQTRPSHSNFCSRIFNNGGLNKGGCLLDRDCIENCFQLMYGYSAECSSCFGAVPTCSVGSGCTAVCAADSLGDECKMCNIPCVEELGVCTGLPKVNTDTNVPPTINETTKVDTDIPLPLSTTNDAIKTNDNACNDFDLEGINTWYDVYHLTFYKSIQDAWNGDAKLLAVIIVLFSGIWPYLKNIILVIIWYTPATVETQTSTLLWLSRLSKYTLVDVFAVIGVLVGVQLQLNVGGTEAVTRAEPRFGIIAFFVATVWEFLQIELIKAMHEKKVLLPNHTEAGEDRLYFSRLWVPVLFLLVSVGLYIAGTITEVVYFASADFGSNGVCKRSYNLVTLGNALINEMSMTSNSTPGQTWILYLSYVALILMFPILTHVLQICFITGWAKSKKLQRLFDWTLAIWFFACVDVLLIGIFAVEYKFPNLIMKIAGETNSTFLDIESNLGVGFYILIAYSVVAGFLQFSLRIRQDKKEKEDICSVGKDDA